MRHQLERLDLDDVRDVHTVKRPGCERVDLAGGIVTQIDKLEPVDKRPVSPVVALRPQQGTSTDLVLDQTCLSRVSSPGCRCEPRIRLCLLASSLAVHRCSTPDRIEQ